MFPSRTGWPSAVVCPLVGLSLCFGAVALLWLGVIRDHNYVAIIGVVVMAAWGAFFIGAGVVAVRRVRRVRRVPSGLLLTPQAVCGPDGKSVLPWDVIASVDTKIVNFWFRRNYPIRKKPLIPVRANYLTVSVTGTDRVEGLRPWVRRLSQRVSRPVILRLANSTFQGNPAAPLHALRHYLAHPQDRAELANGAALIRILGERS